MTMSHRDIMGAAAADGVALSGAATAQTAPMAGPAVRGKDGASIIDQRNMAREAEETNTLVRARLNGNQRTMTAGDFSICW